jgi:hypothetical protein
LRTLRRSARSRRLLKLKASKQRSNGAGIANFGVSSKFM